MRLHRVADEEQRAAVALLPAGGQLLEQLHWRVRGVLELVDQDVRDLLVEREQQVARVVDRAERAHRAVRELGEVGLAALARTATFSCATAGCSSARIASSASHCRSSYFAGGMLQQGDERLAQRLVAGQGFGAGASLAPVPFLVRSCVASSSEAPG